MVIANILDNHALYHILTKNFDDALKFANESDDMRRRFLKSPHSDIAKSLNTIGECHLMKPENSGESFDKFNEALDIMYQVLNSETRYNDLIIEILYNLASCEMKKGNFEEAKIKANESYKMKEQLFGENHPGLNRIQRLIDEIQTD